MRLFFLMSILLVSGCASNVGLKNPDFASAGCYKDRECVFPKTGYAIQYQIKHLQDDRYLIYGDIHVTDEYYTGMYDHIRATFSVAMISGDEIVADPKFVVDGYMSTRPKFEYEFTSPDFDRSLPYGMRGTVREY